HRDGAPRRGRRDRALHPPRPVHSGLGPAPLPPPPRRRIGAPMTPQELVGGPGGGAAAGAAPRNEMVIERKWKRWVYFYIPLTVFVIGTLFPFYWMLLTAIRPDSELYHSLRADNTAPF